MLRTLCLSMIAAFSLTLLPGCGSGTTTPTSGATSGGDTKTATAPAQKAPGSKVVAVIPKSTSDEFWLQVKEGAMEAAKDKNVEIVFKAGEPGNQAESQLTLVDQMIAQHVDAIVLAPVDAKFLAQAVDKCADAKIPLVIIDSAVDGDFAKYYTYIATNNKDGGARCAKVLAEALGKKGNVLLFRFSPGSASTEDREKGFIEELKTNYPDVKIIAEKYAEKTREDAIKNATELLAANPAFDGVFACNESSAVGMLKALRERGLAGKVKFVGFDTAKVLLEGVESGEILALAVQKPKLMGNEGVSAALHAIETHEKNAPFTEIQAEILDKKVLSDLEDLKKQEERDKLREEANKKVLEEMEKQNATILKKFEEDNQKLKDALRTQEEDDKKRDAEIARLKALNDKENQAKLKEFESEQAKFKEELSKKQEEEKKHDAELKKMKEDFDKAADEQRKKIEAEQKAHESGTK